MNFYQNKTVIVTGASSGIGQFMVNHLAAAQANIVLCARSKNKMEHIVKELHLPEERYLIIQVDFSIPQDFSAIINQILDKFKQIDILINNAGIAQKSLVQETNEVVERRVMEVNYFAAINFTKALLPHFIQKNKGHLVAISSILGEIGLPFVAPYCASKHAINGYFNSMRYDLEKHNICVSIIEPGFINTEITKKSLTGEGAIHNLDSIAQEKGMNANKCALQILKKVKSEKRKAYVGGVEILMPKFAFYFPRIFHFLMKKMHKI